MNSQKLLFLYFLPLILLFNTSSSNSNKTNTICSSSCGTIHNISHPFRLKSDPKHCGVDTYELSCENNSTVLYLDDGAKKFNVQAINYDNLTIRVTDSGVAKDNCSTTPHFSLSTLIFSYFNTLSYTRYRNDGTNKMYFGESINFIKCSNPVNSPNYMDMSGCVGRSSSPMLYNYAYVGEIVGYDLMKNCSIEMISMMPKTEIKMLRYVDVHREMAFGFELSWHNFFCPDCSLNGCFIDSKSNRIKGCEDNNTCTYLCFASKYNFRYNSLTDLMNEYLSCREIYNPAVKSIRLF
ncbi:hypothetical protein M5689_022259 [Euphorbia peplus]|nr:hypothetical protein M5689_022259 [Euphorbia peplus]